MKRKAEYNEGRQAASNFEGAMRGLFQIPKDEAPPRPKRKAPKKASAKASR